MGIALYRLYLFYEWGLWILVAWIIFFVLLYSTLKLIARYKPHWNVYFSKMRMVFYLSAIYIATIPFAAWGFYYSTGVSQLYRHYKLCAEFPNGVLLGRTSFLVKDKVFYLFEPNPSKIFLSLKLPGGAILTRDNITELHFSKTTIYGATAKSYYDYGDRTKHYFVYRSDVGFVREEDNPTLYAKLKREAGALIKVPEPKERDYQRPFWQRYVNKYAATTYYGLAGDKTYKRETCPLDIFP